LTSLLEINELVAGYGAVRALNGISLHVDEGETVALIGANGAGKTTTLRCISSLVWPSAGTILFEGRRIDRSKPETVVKFGISHAPEGRKIFPGLTVMDNLRLGAVGRSRAAKVGVAEDVARVFALFPPLEAFKNRLGWMLSGGQQQMLSIGRALMAHPRLLLLDEPSLGLAPVLVQSVFKTIREINQAGTAILLVEQNAFMALNTARRAYVLETGKIVLEGDSAALMKDERVRGAYLGAKVSVTEPRTNPASGPQASG
jgi:branched-chain amino acid transport system ATP-binding protein